MSSKRITIKTLLLALLTLLVLPMSAQVDNEDLLDDKDSTQDDTAAVVLTVHHNDSLSWPKNVQEGIDELLRDEMFNTSQVGLLIWDLDADSAIYRYNDRQLLRPASTMKVITAITALDRLGGSYQFKTDLCYTGRVDSSKASLETCTAWEVLTPVSTAMICALSWKPCTAWALTPYTAMCMPTSR